MKINVTPTAGRRVDIQPRKQEPAAVDARGRASMRYC
jgi:hypothetical protein